MPKEVYTITYGEQAENHAGMQKIGKMAKEGFNLDELKNAKKKFESLKAKCELVNLAKKSNNEEINSEIDDAHILIVRNGVDIILKKLKKKHQDLYEEQKMLEYDDKAFMYGRIVNKLARHNICFDNESQTPNIKKGKGRIIAFKDVKLTNYIRTQLPSFLGNKAKALKAEGNYYYDITKCGIGFHGDGERMKVIGVRVGNANLPIHYQWFYKSKPLGDRIILDIRPGDIYIMSQKTTGNDWKKKNIYTLRHAVGADRFITIKKKVKLEPKKVKLDPSIIKELEKMNLEQLEEYQKRINSLKTKKSKETKPHKNNEKKNIKHKLTLIAK